MPRSLASVFALLPVGSPVSLPLSRTQPAAQAPRAGGLATWGRRLLRTGARIFLAVLEAGAYLDFALLGEGACLLLAIALAEPGTASSSASKLSTPQYALRCSRRHPKPTSR